MEGANPRDQWIGEKRDRLVHTDVDGACDPHIVGNVEQHFRQVNGKPVSCFGSVVWFENPSR
ncbi:MAG TPA: hypothetical protein VLH79_14180 [Chthonomonadales bacterium]|nr:hypothetical protein [Chthonomonadales bacterium]